MEYLLSQRSADFLKELMETETNSVDEPIRAKTLTRISPFVVTGTNQGKRLVFDDETQKYFSDSEELEIWNPIADDFPEKGSKVWAVFRGRWEILSAVSGGTRIPECIVTAYNSVTKIYTVDILEIDFDTNTSKVVEANFECRCYQTRPGEYIPVGTRCSVHLSERKIMTTTAVQ